MSNVRLELDGSSVLLIANGHQLAIHDTQNQADRVADEIASALRLVPLLEERDKVRRISRTPPDKNAWPDHSGRPRAEGPIGEVVGFDRSRIVWPPVCRVRFGQTVETVGEPELLVGVKCWCCDGRGTYEHESSGGSVWTEDCRDCFKQCGLNFVPPSERRRERR